MSAGVRGLLAPWIGGAASSRTTTPSGVRSLFAFWMGGAAVQAFTPVPPVVLQQGGGQGGSARRATDETENLDVIRRRKSAKDERELLDILGIMIKEGLL